MSIFLFLLVVDALRSPTIGQHVQSNSDIHQPVKRAIVELPDRPTEVQVGFFVESIGALDSTLMQFQLDFYLRTAWQDNRVVPLIEAQRNKWLNSEGLYVITANDDLLSQIWKPDIYFPNAREAQFHNVTTANFALYIERDTGRVAYSSRITMNVDCNMDLTAYPMDVQSCDLRVMSYAHMASELQLVWFNNASLEMNKQILLPEFKLVEMIAVDECEDKSIYAYAKMKDETKYANFSCLTAQFHFKRQIGFHLVQTYIPTAAIVVISWVSFWIEPGAVPARVSLSFTTLLTLTTMAAGVRYSLPAVSYAKAIDYWMGACMFFVFGALVEFAMVNSYTRRAKRCDRLADVVLLKQRSRTGVPPDSTLQSINGYGAAVLSDVGGNYSKRALMIDQISRVVFPLAFAIFSCIYWLYYLQVIRWSDLFFWRYFDI